MKRFICWINLFCFVIMQFFVIFASPVSARQISKEGQIFESVKEGVVTISTSALSHGSGFVVDQNGLIITNSHVVAEGQNNITVRFNKDEALKGQVIVNDRDNDIAIIRVNLKNIKNYKVLKLFTPENNEPLVLVGEEIITIGTPIDLNTLEKIMTKGMIGKYNSDKGIINHDASINGGNSGGPLLNFDGLVVGINTFIQKDRGPAIAGCIAIDKALPLLGKAKEQIATLPEPSEELMQKTAQTSYPINLVKDQLKDTHYEYSFFHGKRLKFLKNHISKSRYYSQTTMTPLVEYKKQVAEDNEYLKRRLKKAKKGKIEVSQDEYDSSNYSKVYNFNKPVVTVLTYPRPRLTKASVAWITVGSIICTGLTFGIGFIYTPLFIAMGKTEFKHDFESMTLETKDGQILAKPLSGGRIPLKANYIMYYSDGISTSALEKLKDKSYIGVYEFDPKVFDTDKVIYYSVKSEGSTKFRKSKISEKTKAQIKEDFKPYFDYINSGSKI